jgi:hypothetical protein
MADNGGMRLGLMFVVGALLIDVGITGRLGSLLGAIIDPNSMTDQGPANSTGLGGNSAGLPTSGTLTAAQIGRYALNAGFPASSLQIAIAVALAESGGNTKSHNPGNGTTDIEDSYGLWQINVLAHSSYSPSSLYTPLYNAHAAYDISAGGTNWHPWGTYQTGRYLTFMDQAQAGAGQAIMQNTGII